MATRTIAHMFDSYQDASAAVSALEAAGFSHDDVSIVANQGGTETGAAAPTTDASGMGTAGMDSTGLGTTGAGTPGIAGDAADNAAAGTGTGASVGTLLGGGAGLLAGIGALAIPGVGPIVAAGWLVATLTGAGVGAAAGGLLGSLTGAGISEEHAHVYAEGVRRGGTRVTVRADDSRAAQAESILGGYRPVDVAARGADYRTSDPSWSGFDAARGVMTPQELAAERARVDGRVGL